MLRKRGLLTVALLLTVSLAQAERIVVLTPEVADIVVALGATQEVVGRERSSTAPALKNVPVIGFLRALNAETIAGVKPTLVIGSNAAQPPAIWDQLKRLKINAVQVSSREDGTDFAQSIRRIGQLIHKEQNAQRIADQWQRGMGPLPATKKRYVISYDGHIVAGADTAADTLIRAAGGINAAGNLKGFKPLTREAWQSINPDVIILGGHAKAVHGGAAAFRKRPEIAATPAGKNGKIYVMTPQQALMINLDSPATIRKMNRF